MKYWNVVLESNEESLFNYVQQAFHDIVLYLQSKSGNLLAFEKNME